MSEGCRDDGGCDPPGWGGDVLAEWAQRLTGQTAGRSRGPSESRFFPRYASTWVEVSSEVRRSRFVRVKSPARVAVLKYRLYDIRMSGYLNVTSQRTTSGVTFQ